MYKVYDDILTPEEQSDFLNLVLGNNFPWFFIDTPDQTSVDNFIKNKWADENTLEAKVMVHTFMQDGEINSNVFDKVEYLLNKFIEKTGEEIKSIIRCKLNLQYKVLDYDENKYQTPHKDQDFDHNVLIYYPFTSDGDTFIFNEIQPKKYEVIDRIKPLGGRFLLMNNMFHAGQPPMKHETRMALNYNLN